MYLNLDMYEHIPSKVYVCTRKGPHGVALTMRDWAFFYLFIRWCSIKIHYTDCIKWKISNPNLRGKTLDSFHTKHRTTVDLRAPPQKLNNRNEFIYGAMCVLIFIRTAGNSAQARRKSRRVVVVVARTNDALSICLCRYMRHNYAQMYIAKTHTHFVQRARCYNLLVR